MVISTTKVKGNKVIAEEFETNCQSYACRET